MGRISIACFRPKPGKEAELLRVIDDRLPLLRRLGLATDRAAINCRSKEGIMVSISEWVSDEAIDRAHRTPEVLALWRRFEECATFVPFTATSESADLFATFDAV
ncbi:MAG: antibiotic biosynthesis monooxygenase [Phycisphaerales bacterium]